MKGKDMNASTLLPRRTGALLVGAALLAGAAHAHVVLDYQAAPAGSSYRAAPTPSRVLARLPRPA